MTEEIDITESTSAIMTSSVFGQIVSEEDVQLVSLSDDDQSHEARSLIADHVDDVTDSLGKRSVAGIQRRTVNVDLGSARNAKNVLNLNKSKIIYQLV